MTIPKTRFSLFSLVLSGFVLSASALLAQEADGRIDLSDFPADYVEAVVVPVPGEILAVLEKLGESGWEAEMRPGPKGSLRLRIDHALALGVAVADGFVAVQAQDEAGVQAVGRAVLRYAEALGLRATVTRHCQAILDAADAGDWKAVRRELDLTEVTARAELMKLDDGPLAAGVSLGGWVRGTEVATSVISKSFTADKAELLNQPALVKHFGEKVRSLDEETRALPKMVAISKSLEEIEALMGAEDEPVPSDAVVAMNEACKRVVDVILGVEAPEEEGGDE